MSCLPIRPSFNLFIHLPIHSLTHPPIHLLTHPHMLLSTSPFLIHSASKMLSIPPAMLLPIHLFIHLHIYPFMHQTIHLSAYIIAHPFILSPIHSSLIHLGVYTSTSPHPHHLFTHLRICLSVYLSIFYPSTFKSICSFTSPSVHPSFRLFIHSSNSD